MTTDPITGEDLSNPEVRHFVVESEGRLAVKIYTESEETGRRCLDIGIEHPGRDLRYTLDNPDPNAAGDN